METIGTLFSSEYLDRFTVGKKPARNERDEQLAHFLNRGIQVRDGKRGFRDATARDLAIALAHIPTGDLYAFHRQCEQARSYRRFFWSSLKPRT